MQSSGVGNCINALALTTIARLPMLMLVTMRGEWAEFNPWQVPMGSATAIPAGHWRADDPGRECPRAGRSRQRRSGAGLSIRSASCGADFPANAWQKSMVVR